MTRWLLLFVAIALAAWWYASPRSPSVSSSTSTSSRQGCVPPHQLALADGPIQSALSGAMSPFTVDEGVLQPLAGFSVDARVLSRKKYSSDRESDFSPIDLALGWGQMRDDKVLSQLNIDQSGRWYHYRWEGHPPISPTQIARQSANMHMIPSSAAVAEALDAVRPNDNVRIDGWLVQVSAPDGWRWRSSTTRKDTGAGACELIYVCTVTRNRHH